MYAGERFRETQPNLTSAPLSTREDWVKLNVGGRPFLTSRSTLRTRAPESMLSRMLVAEEEGAMRAGVRDADGAILLDRDPDYFAAILNYLRTGNLYINADLNLDGAMPICFLKVSSQI